MKTKPLIILLLALATPRAGYGDSTVYLGYTGYIQGTSKARGMGGAFTGVADDISSIVYNPAGFVFSDFRNYASFSHINFSDASLDLDRSSEDDVWTSQAFSFGYLHRTRKKNRFTWGIYLYNLYNIIITNDKTRTDSFILPLGGPGDSFEMQFGLGGFVLPFIWQPHERLAASVSVRSLNAELKYHEKTAARSADLLQNRGVLRLEFSLMHRLVPRKLNLGLLLRPAVYFPFDTSLNAQSGGFRWFQDVNVPTEINAGLGFLVSDRLTAGFDVHYAAFRGDERLVGSNLVAGFEEYRLATTYALSPHFGAEYRTAFLARDLFLRGGYYYQPGIFEGLSSKNHFTYSVSWRAIKLPPFLLFEYLSLGLSGDIAEKYRVQAITLDGDF